MGASESTFSRSQRPDDGITTVSERSEAVDPILERLKSLKFTSPILTSPPTESSLTDILVRKPSSSSVPAIVNPNVLLELFSIYRDWQEDKARKISKNQEEIENKIEVADALAVKLLQRFNYSVSAMKTTSQHLSEVHPLQVEIGDLKGRLTEVISNCDALCKRIATEGPESIRSSIKPFAVTAADTEICYSSSTQQTILDQNPPSAEAKTD
ncbi:Sodium-dependent phosphate transporter 1 [Quillaja saponaria]|uniref:Sodium-dependent phosphate transporter 1 n=1 Tax=Quillaja saponaria TaxID=32244 RepID=A0AAD7L978_QUISA|nr:Sodium-dependent phosphate transporter 1 [Quillaja saponaria]KAJ7953102.1 Sodium-dependent phosphate transporter 1 [Quillaja saponaria]